VHSFSPPPSPGIDKRKNLHPIQRKSVRPLTSFSLIDDQTTILCSLGGFIDALPFRFGGLKSYLPVFLNGQS
jgi:hypothetical protein